MAIDKKLIHFKSKDNFMSANGVNGSIDSPSSGSEENGNAEYGQVKGTSIAFVKDSKEIWTHGNLYKSVNWSTLGEDDNTTDGYHAELQDKTVEITENGQVEVSADAGYYGLNKVSINTEIKSQSTMEYLDVSGADNITLLVAKQCASLVKWESTNSSNAGEITIAPLGLLSPGSSNGQETAIYMAVAIDLAQLIVAPVAGVTEPSPLSSFIGSMLASLPRITEEEFYNIES